MGWVGGGGGGHRSLIPSLHPASPQPPLDVPPLFPHAKGGKAVPDEELPPKRHVPGSSTTALELVLGGTLGLDEGVEYLGARNAVCL